MIGLYKKHYITVNDGRIIDGFSEVFKQPKGEDICINEQGGYQFRLFPNGEENPPLIDFNGCHLYCHEGGQIRKATDAELAAELAEIEANRPPMPPTVEQQLYEAQLLIGDQIEANIDLDYRLSMIELGLN